MYHLFERGSRKSQEKVKSVVEKSSTLGVAPKGGKCCDGLVTKTTAVVTSDCRLLDVGVNP